MEPLANIFQQGGCILYVIAGGSVIAWVKILALWQRQRECTGRGWPEVVQAVEDLRAGRPVDAAVAQASRENLVGRLLQSDLLTARLDRHDFEALVTPFLRCERVQFERSLQMIAVLAACMPLLGLLGTVIGMVETFGALTRHGGARADSLASGISQALITTQAGLVVGLSVLLMHGYLSSQTRRYLDTLGVLVKIIETAVCAEDELDESPQMERRLPTHGSAAGNGDGDAYGKG